MPTAKQTSTAKPTAGKASRKPASRKTTAKTQGQTSSPRTGKAKPTPPTPKRKPATPARAKKPTPAAIPLSSISRKSHTVRVKLRGRKGRMWGSLVKVQSETQEITLDIVWMKAPKTISLADVVEIAARPSNSGVPYVPVEVDA